MSLQEFFSLFGIVVLLGIIGQVILVFVGIVLLFKKDSEKKMKKISKISLIIFIIIFILLGLFTAREYVLHERSSNTNNIQRVVPQPNYTILGEYYDQNI